MKTLLILTLFFCLVRPTTSLARDISDFVDALGMSTAEFQDNAKLLTGDSLEGRGMVFDVKTTGIEGLFDIYIVAGDNTGVVVVVSVSSSEIPFQSKDEVRFSGRIKSITIRHAMTGNPPGGKQLLVILSDGDVGLAW
jgi:hypothetical protein